MSTLESLLIKIGIDERGVPRAAAGIRKSLAGLQKNADTAFRATAAIGTAMPVVAGVAGGVASIGVALGAAGAAAGVFGAVAKSAMTEVTENATKVEDLTDKMALYGREAKLAAAAGGDSEKYLKKQAEAALELRARLANLPPATRNATMAFVDMKSGWGDFVDANKPATFGIMEKGYRLVGSAIGDLQPFFDAGARAAGRLVDKVQGWVAGGGLERLGAVAGPALDSLTTALTNAGEAAGRMFGKLGAEQGQGFLDWLVKITDRWLAWTKTDGQNEGVNKFITYVKDSGPVVVDTLTRIATAAVAIAKAVAPLAPITAAVAGALASIVAALPPDVITAIVTAMIAYSAAMKAYALYTAIATAAQWAYNVAQMASPTTWIILAIVALIAVIVLVATKTRFFQTVWEAVWGFMKKVGAWFAGPFANFFVTLWNKITASLSRAKTQFLAVINFIKNLIVSWYSLQVRIVTGIINYFIKVVNYVRSIPGRIKGALSSMWDGMKSGFRSAINWVIGKWNSLHFTIPSFSVFGKSFGGGTIGVPSIPQLATGGIVPARPGGTLVRMGEAGEAEAAVPISKLPDMGGGAREITLIIKGDDTASSRYALQMMRKAVSDRGGNVQVVVGKQRVG